MPRGFLEETIQVVGKILTHSKATEVLESCQSLVVVPATYTSLARLQDGLISAEFIQINNSNPDPEVKLLRMLCPKSSIERERDHSEVNQGRT